MGKYKFNREQLKFVEDKKNVKDWVKRIVKYIVVSILLAVLYYLVISLFFSTDQERQLGRENKILEEEYKKMARKMDLLDNAVQSLQIKDREIYRSIFDADPPRFLYDGSDDNGFLDQIDTLHNEKIIDRSREEIRKIESQAGNVDEAISMIGKAFEELGEDVRNIPSIVPVRNFSISQTGASVGKKINPFYKSVVMHGGIDLLGATGTEIIAPARGIVEKTVHSRRGEGNTITINHQNGYVTRYTHLGDILVRQGQKIEQGAVIARIGMSGMSFVPHLHYEIIYEEENLDPINYFFADLNPAMFREMATITANTGQSLD